MLLALARRLETSTPSGRVPQYETVVPMFPRNNMSNHVAGNVATKKTMVSEIRLLIMQRV